MVADGGVVGQGLGGESGAFCQVGGVQGEYLAVEPPLGGEVLVDERLGGSGRARDRRQRHLLVGAGRELPPRDVQNESTAFIGIHAQPRAAIRSGGHGDSLPC